MKTCTLCIRTIELVKARPKTLTFKQISDETKLNYWWLKDFSRGRTLNPQVVELQTLYEYLSGTKLILN